MPPEGDMMAMPYLFLQQLSRQPLVNLQPVLTERSLAEVLPRLEVRQHLAKPAVLRRPLPAVAVQEGQVVRLNDVESIPIHVIPQKL